MKPSEFMPNDDEWEAKGMYRQEAEREAVDTVLNAQVGHIDGRSEWFFLRLPTGDLVLATYPRGDTYLATVQWRSI